jgi:hypothetical protein
MSAAPIFLETLAKLALPVGIAATLVQNSLYDGM